MSSPAAVGLLRVPIVVIGGGQAGLSSAYHLRDRGLVPDHDFTLLDRSPGPGGAWQCRWPSLTLSTVNGVHDLPGGLSLASSAGYTNTDAVRAAEAIPRYFGKFEAIFSLPVHRPIVVLSVRDRGGRLRIETNRGLLLAQGIINATGTWDAPHRPVYQGTNLFRGRQLHARDYRDASTFVGEHVVVVGGGISAVQILEEISRITTTTWVTRRPPVFHDGPFTAADGRAAVSLVEAECAKAFRRDRSFRRPDCLPPRSWTRRGRVVHLYVDRCSPKSPRPASAGPTERSRQPT